ncbi:MAG: methyltransferase [Planctomycetota bacterium]|nr:MAG: methyltransferase [Planctomycetota bacterium]
MAKAARALRLSAPPPPPPAALPRVRARKAGQVQALVRLVRTVYPGCRRLVDVGAGTGHLTRALAAALGVEALGIERDPARVEAARALSGSGGPRFEARAVGPGGLELGPDDLAIGLHACGALGDALVRAAVRGGARLLLVNCCLQKVDGVSRTPLSATGRRCGLVLAREALGLSNLSARPRLVEGDHAQWVAVRRTRYALRLLLAERGLAVAVGEEMRGLRRRHARHGLAALAARACARRGLAPPTLAELARAEARARADYGRLRRLSLPRALLGPLLEQAVGLDRACLLEEAGRVVRLKRVFSWELSPRNLAVLAP